MEALETFEHAGFVCELHYDETPTSPGDWDQLGTLYQFGRAWLSGAKDAAGDIEEARERGRPGLVVRALALQGDAAVLFKLEDYGSNGWRLRPLDDDEDERATGYIAGNLARIVEEGPVDGDWRRALLGELGDWDNFVQGNVFGYIVRDPRTRGVLDSVWGFYPDGQGQDGLDYLRWEARQAAESERDAHEERRRRTVDGWALAHAREAMPV